jgi:hypothetical protein
MYLWVGIKRTCMDLECRERAKNEQLEGPKVNQNQILEMIREEELKRQNKA